MSCCKLCKAVAALVLLASIYACGGGVTLPPLPPTFLEVTPTADGLRTSYRPDAADAQFTFFTHNDVFNDNACGDMGIAPDGIMRYVAVLQPAQPRGRNLVIRTGLGPSNWSTTFSTRLTPDSAGFSTGCPRIAHMRDGLYAVVWTNSESDSLFNAVYNAAQPSAEDLQLGVTIRRPARMQAVAMRNITPVFFRGLVNLVWSDEAHERINRIRGTINAGGIVFDPTVRSTAVAHSALSDAVVLGDTMFIAVHHGDRVALRRATADNLPFEEIASCSSSQAPRGRLLFRDASGTFWVSESAMPQNSTNFRLRSFQDCTTREIAAPIVLGQVYYHPGRP